MTADPYDDGDGPGGCAGILCALTASVLLIIGVLILAGVRL